MARHQRPGELQQLALAAREGAGIVIRELRQVEDLEQLHRLRREPPPRALRTAPGWKIKFRNRSPGWSGAASIMLSITGIAASALVIWKVRTIPLRAIS